VAYFSSDDNLLGNFGCGADCSCKACRSGNQNLSQVYEEEEPPPPSAPAAQKMAGWVGGYSLGRARPFAAARFGWPGWGLGQPALRAPWRSRLQVGATPPYLRFLNLDQFDWSKPSLTARHLPMVKQLADHVQASWKTMQPIGLIRLIGHTDDTGPEKFNVSLGNQRAESVKSALETILKNDIISGRIRIAILVEASPGESTPIASNRTIAGRALNRRVEVFIAPPLPPTPPISSDRPVRLPTPEETARRAFRDETIEERINRILRTLPPPPLARRSLSQMFWQRVDENLDSAMSRIGIPDRIRGKLREGAHAAITRGAEAIFDQVLDAAEVTGSAREALKNAVSAALQTPVR
jgi:outer membrane protein OmpA-like peptidoglycan-associated protein